jgi:hypothetical protein
MSKQWAKPDWDTPDGYILVHGMMIAGAYALICAREDGCGALLSVMQVGVHDRFHDALKRVAGET